jgi:hypothetical protein
VGRLQRSRCTDFVQTTLDVRGPDCPLNVFGGKISVRFAEGEKTDFFYMRARQGVAQKLRTPLTKLLLLTSAFHGRSPVHQPWYRVLYFGYVPRVLPASGE